MLCRIFSCFFYWLIFPGGLGIFLCFPESFLDVGRLFLVRVAVGVVGGGKCQVLLFGEGSRGVGFGWMLCFFLLACFV